jgi:hypothetical protein
LSQLGEGSLVLKEAMGVSGRGISVIETPARMEKLLQFLKRSSGAKPRVDFVLEKWIDKERDVNYQISISPNGQVKLINIKEAITYGGVHAGHRWPIALTEEQHESYERAAREVGRQLHADGFYGIAGIDSVIDKAGVVYPVLEINARMNMSTFELRLDDLCDERLTKALKYYSFQASRYIDFDSLLLHIGDDLFQVGSDRGIGIFCFATVNCNLSPSIGGDAAKGRLYAFLVGRNWLEIDRLDGKMRTVLERCGAKTM